MEMGASTVFEKPVDDNAFLNALERFCFEDTQRVLKRRLCLAVQQDIAKLSEIERSTLEQMRLGLSNKAIARKLGKSVKAIERHRQCMVHKLGCASAIEVLQKDPRLARCTVTARSAAPRTVVRKADTSA